MTAEKAHGSGNLRKGLPACLITCLLVFSMLPQATASPGNSFTLRIGKLSMRNVSNLLELLGGKIKTRDVVMENLLIEIPQSGGTLKIFVPEVKASYAVMEVSLLQVLGLSITHLCDLVPLLLGKAVTWKNVTITAGYMYAESLQLKNQRIWAGRGGDGFELTADKMFAPSLSIDDTLGDNRFVISVPQTEMENMEQEMGEGVYLIAPKLTGSSLKMETVSVFSSSCSMVSMEVTEKTRTAPHRVVAKGVVMENLAMRFLKMEGGVEFPQGFRIVRR